MTEINGERAPSGRVSAAIVLVLRGLMRRVLAPARFRAEMFHPLRPALLPVAASLLLGVAFIGCASPPPPVSVAEPVWGLGPFVRHAENPILGPEGASWQSKDVFNPAAWTDGERVYLLYRAEDSTGIGVWNGTSRIGLATSDDGLVFQRESDPVFGPSEPYELPGGTEDPRLVNIDETFYLTYTAYDGETARLALATSKDLRTWDKRGVLFPDRGWTKSGAILSHPIDGRYWMYFGDTNVWAAHSRDLVHWTVVEEPVLRPRPDRFDSRLVEPGPPPILTEDGILLLYNAASDDLVYGAGQVLLDRQDPTRVLARSETPFLSPAAALERDGQVDEVVFVEGLVFLRGRWYLYYGMGDSGIGVAVYDPTA